MTGIPVVLYSCDNYDPTYKAVLVIFHLRLSPLQERTSQEMVDGNKIPKKTKKTTKYINPSEEVS